MTILNNNILYSKLNIYLYEMCGELSRVDATLWVDGRSAVWVWYQSLGLVLGIALGRPQALAADRGGARVLESG